MDARVRSVRRRRDLHPRVPRRDLHAIDRSLARRASRSTPPRARGRRGDRTDADRAAARGSRFDRDRGSIVGHRVVRARRRDARAFARDKKIKRNIPRSATSISRRTARRASRVAASSYLAPKSVGAPPSGPVVAGGRGRVCTPSYGLSRDRSVRRGWGYVVGRDSSRVPTLRHARPHGAAPHRAARARRRGVAASWRLARRRARRRARPRTRIGARS